jgi:hypothetical protein
VVYCGIYKNSYNISNISYLISPLHHSPLSSSPPILGIISTGIFFLLHICIHSICTSSFEKYLFSSFAHLLTGLFVLLLFSFFEFFINFGY